MKASGGTNSMVPAFARACAAAILALASACASAPGEAQTPPAAGTQVGFAPAPPKAGPGAAAKDHCIVSGKPLPADPPTISYRRAIYRFCSPECLQAFMKDPEAAIKNNPVR